MPAAAKIEKPAAANGELTNGKGKPTSNGSNNGVASLLQEPQKIVNTIIEKKVRNLEKRKIRLLEIKAMEDKGQKLEEEQKDAVKKLPGVTDTIDMLKEIGKNATDGLNDYSKALKKQQKRESFEKQAERQQQDAERVKLWLNAQYILARLQTAKNDLLQGENGAVKLEENQVDALEKLVEVLTPQSVDLIESSTEKVNYLLEGNKREFTTGVSYSVLRETLLKLIESKYFDNVAVPTTNNDKSEVLPSEDKEETVDEQVKSEPVTNPEPVQISNEKHVDQVEAKQVPQNSVHINQQLCFMRDPESEIQQNDPAVVAVGSSGFAYPPHGLPASSGSNIVPSNTISTHYQAHNMYPVSAVSIGSVIPTQTFTNPSYTTLLPGHPSQFIPVSMPGQIPHQMQIPEQNMAVLNVGQEVTPIPSNEKPIDQTPSDNLSPKEAPIQQTSQDGEGKPVNGHQVVNGGTENGVSNGHFKRNHNRGGPRGGNGPREGGNFRGNPNGGNYRGGPRGGGKPFNGGNAHFNGNFNGNNPGNTNGQNGNYYQNRPPVNRQNGGPGGNRSGPNFRQGGVPRTNSNFNNNQAAPVSAK